jgi:tRNA G18 (ribose-2'-O)-methylase SpoU
LANLAKGQNLKPKFLSKDKLDKYAQSKSHEGVCLKVEHRNYIEIKKFQEVKKLLKKDTGNIIVLVEKLSDPIYLGLICRNCVYLGTDLLIIGKEDRAALTGQVAKISNGASEWINIYSIKFIKQFIQDSQKSGWKVISLANQKDQRTINLNDLPVSKDKNYILLFSSDETNLTENTINTADIKVYLPPGLDESLANKHPYNLIQSLNISVITGLLINHLKLNMK